MSNEKKNVTVRTGFPIGTILTLIFVVLKLTGHIDWSWWWVLSPLWIGAALIIFIFGILVLWILKDRR